MMTTAATRKVLMPLRDMILSKSYRVILLGQIVALVMMNNHMKFHKICFNTLKVISKVKVCHDDDDEKDYTATDDDTRVMTIHRLLKTCCGFEN